LADGRTDGIIAQIAAFECNRGRNKEEDPHFFLLSPVAEMYRVIKLTV
jgi:hypothetical protein